MNKKKFDNVVDKFLTEHVFKNTTCSNSKFLGSDGVGLIRDDKYMLMVSGGYLHVVVSVFDELLDTFGDDVNSCQAIQNWVKKHLGVNKPVKFMVV